MAVDTLIRRQVPVRTFGDWNDPPPGYMEGDLVAHCGDQASGSFVYTLSLTDICSGWTECVPLVVRQAVLVTKPSSNCKPRCRFLCVDSIATTAVSF